MVRTDQVAQLAAAVLDRALRMLVPEQPRKEPRLFAPGDRAHVKADNRIDTIRNPAGGGHRLRQGPGTACNTHARSRRRKPYAPRRFQVAERRNAARFARIAERIDKIEPGADLPRECRPARKAPGRRKSRENLPAVVGKQ